MACQNWYIDVCPICGDQIDVDKDGKEVGTHLCDLIELEEYNKDKQYE